MSDFRFIHLHNHSHYSLLDGLPKIDELVRHTKDLDMPAVALTDHGNMSGSVQLWSECKKQNIKPIIGSEIYISITDMTDKVREKGQRHYNHFVLLAMNKTGYQNLCKIVSAGYTQGFYYRPRVDKKFLSQHAEGLYALSACMGSEIARELFMASNDEEAIQGAAPIAKEFYELFKGNFRLEMQDHGIPEQIIINNRMIKLSQNTGIPLVWTNDSHFLKLEDFEPHKALICIGSRGKEKLDAMDHVYKPDHCMKSTEEVLKLAEKYSIEHRDIIIKSMKETEQIATQCDFKFDSGTYYFPKYSTVNNEPISKYFYRRVNEGFTKRHKEIIPSRIAEYGQRLLNEIHLIQKMGFEPYFLLIADTVQYAKDNKIAVGPGRGSVGGSLVAFALGITDVDPVRHNLLFERFLNPERISMPDIDLDFSRRRRQEVIEYVVNKYGQENVAQIATFSTLQPKAAINDIGRVIGYSLAETRKLSSLCPGTGNKPISLGTAVKTHQPLKEIIENKTTLDTNPKRILELAVKLEETNRQIGTHAAGLVITPTPISDYCPLWYIPKTEATMTGYDMTDLEKIGLVKMDFLGLKTLDVIHDTFEIINKNGGKVQLADIGYEYNDPLVYKNIFANGHTRGVFQFESPGIRHVLLALNPTCFEDIVAVNALYRPGPMDANMLRSYINRKNGHEEPETIHSALDDVLKTTYGIMVYQEQVIEAIRKLAGYTLGQADVIRKAMGKKDPELMQKEIQKFIEAGVDQGWTRPDMVKIAENIQTFSRYGFNRSHSVEYSALAYQTAWLKYYYPIEFMTALLSAEAEDNKPENIQNYIAECVSKSIKILAPDVNYSDKYFSYENGSIRYGLAAILNVGHGMADTIIKERQSYGSYKSFPQFLSRLNLNSKAIDALVSAGATESLGGHRAQHMASYPDLLKKRRKYRVPPQQTSLLSQFSSQEVLALMQDDLIQVPVWDRKTLQDSEYRALGIYLTDHPLNNFNMDNYLDKSNQIIISDINQAMTNTDTELRDNVAGNVLGVVVNKSHKTFRSKDGRPAGLTILTLDDRSGRLEVAIFERQDINALPEIGDVIRLSGYLNYRTGRFVFRWWHPLTSADFVGGQEKI